ncbi:MAG: hypothetical protein IJJ11_03950 [Methanosphaera sp.]|nr:hypothetical protein [Methanosphaera sp.]
MKSFSKQLIVLGLLLLACVSIVNATDVSDDVAVDSIETPAVDTPQIETNVQEQSNSEYNSDINQNANGNRDIETTFSDQVLDIQDDRYNYQTLTLNDNVLVHSSTDFQLTNVAFNADGNNITIEGLTINNYNDNNNGIVVTVSSGSSNVNIINNTISNQRTEHGKIQAVFVNSSENVNIIDNILTVEGVPQALGWYNITPTKWLSDAKLSGVLVLNSESVNVSNNIITVLNTTDYGIPEEYTTVEGLTIKSGTTNSVFDNNTITVNGSEYIYGISVSEGVTYINITNNDVYLNGTNYICGINLDNITYSNITGNLINGTCLNTSETPIRSNESMAYGINLISQNITIDTETNFINVTDNTINLTSTIAYGIECYYVDNIKIEDNKINLTANKAMGIAATIMGLSNITANKINVTTCNDRELKNVTEAIPPITTGIYLLACVDMEGNITENVINVTETHDEGDIYSIILRSTNLEEDYGVYENYMSSYSTNTTLEGDDSVDDLWEETDVSNNHALNEWINPSSSFFSNNLINNKQLKSSPKTSPKTIVLNETTYDTYITNGYLNDNVSEGDVIDITSQLDSGYYSLIINKPVNITSSNGEALLIFHTGSTDSYGGYSGGIFKVLPEGSNSNITNIRLKSTRVSIEGASNLFIDNITVDGGSGHGVGSFSIRNNSNNITIINSVFLTKDNGGHSNVVFAGAQNCVFENNTVTAEGNVGNIIYLTTYNTVPVVGDYLNNNITIRNNYIDGSKASVQMICYGIALEGNGIIIDNNTILYGGEVIINQWGGANINNVTISNNKIPNGHTYVSFKNTTAYGNEINNAYLANVNAYNNTFGTAILSDYDNLTGNTFEYLTFDSSNRELTNDNNISNLIISGSNNNVHDLKFTNLTISGQSNNITDTQSEYVLITGDNNNFTCNNVSSSYEYSINVTGQSNTITDNLIYSLTKCGDNAVYTTKTNIIENNLPLNNETFVITDDNYSQFFDENGFVNANLIPNYANITLNGDFYNKDFKFKDNVYTITGDEAVLYNATILSNDSRLVIFNITINNTGVANAINVNSDGSILKNIKIYSDNSGDMDAVILNGNNIEFSNNLINITSSAVVTAIKVIQTDSNTIRNNTIYIKGSDVVAVNVTGSKVSNHMEENKITVNATNVMGILVNADNISSTNLSYANITVNALDTATGIIIDNNECALDNYLYRVVITLNAENTSFIKINQQNKTCDNNTISMSWFNSNATNTIGITLNGDNFNSAGTLTFNVTTTNSFTGIKITGTNNTIKCIDSEITGSNTADDLSKSQLLYVYNSEKFQITSESYHNLTNSTAIVIENTTNSVIFAQNINIKGEGVGCIISNVTDTIFQTNTFNTSNPLIITDSDNNNFTFSAFNNDATVVLNNSKNNIFNRTDFNSNEFTFIELEESNTIYSSNTFRSNMKFTLKNSTLMENKINNITLMDSNNINIFKNIINETLNINNSDSINITNNTINTNQEYTVILNNTSNTLVKGNILYASEKEGDNSVFNNDSSNTVIDNAPDEDIILTDENYDQYFDENSRIIKETPFINVILGSDLYNKDLTFIQKTNMTNPDKYTIYNSTITFTDNSNHVNSNYVDNLVIKNINKDYAFVLNGSTTINNTEIYNGTVFSSAMSSIYNVTINNTDDRISSVINTNIKYSNIYQENRINQAKVIVGSTIAYNNITLNGNGTVFNNITSLRYNNITVNSSDTVVILIKNSTNDLTVQNNNINVTSENKVVVIDYQSHDNYIKIEKNNITTNTLQGTTPLIIIKEAPVDNTNTVKDNYIESIDLKGNHAVSKNKNVTISNNIPVQTLTMVLTDDNYGELFEDELFIFDADVIELGSDIYNKNMIFDQQNLELTNPNNYTIYNGTITLNQAKNIKINHININNTDKSVLLINDAQVTFTENNIYTQSDNQELIVLNTPNLKSTITNNNLISTGNNNTLYALYLNNLRSPTFKNNNMTIEGDDNTAIRVVSTNSRTPIESSRVFVNTDKASTPIVVDKASVNFMNNVVLVNTTQNGVPIIKVTYTKGEVSNNYIESLDLVGNDAVDTTATKKSNTPTTTGYISKLDYIIIPEEIVVNEENILTITPTDAFGREITGTVTVTDGENTYTTDDNEITYTSTTTGDKTLTITYTDPTGKYNTTTKTVDITVQSPTLTIDPITATAGDIINITARITANNQTITSINAGKIAFKVNGKTLKDANGKVIYVKVVNGTATIENYIVPTDWTKEGTTIEAIYSGSTKCAKLTSQKTDITVAKSVPTLTTESITAGAGDTITLTATITDGDKLISSGKVVFKINGKTVKDANGKVIYAKVSNNQVSVTYTLPEDMKAKDYNITAVFSSSDYDRLEDTKVLTVN